MVVTCDIQFEDNAEGIYYAGQVVMGKVTLTVEKIKQVEAVKLKIHGSAKTRWKKRGSKKRGDTTYWGQVDYINTLICLLAHKSTDQSVAIEPGIHTFSFACHIPVNCPSSFEGDHGSIRFIVQITLVRPWKFDQTFTKAFTVLTIKDLNYDSYLLKSPVTNDISKIFCCGPFKSEPLKINVQLPQTGFVPGQLIPVSILVTNETKARINEICVRLAMVITFISTHPRDQNESQIKTVSKLIGDPVIRNCKKHFNYLLPIPATPPTCTSLCSIIQIAYRIEIEAEMGIMYTNQCIQIPVTIGNVPLYTDRMVVQQQPMSGQLGIQNRLQVQNENSEVRKLENNNDPIAANENIEPWSALGNIPAPIYAVAAHLPQGQLSEDSTYDYGDKSFTPKYPVFNIPCPTRVQQTNGDEIDAVPPMITDPDKTTWL